MRIISDVSAVWVRCRIEAEEGHLLAVVCVRAVVELNAGEGARDLAATWDPGDGGALVEEVDGVEELLALLLDEAHAQHLALLLVGDQLRGQYLHRGWRFCEGLEGCRSLAYVF